MIKKIIPHLTLFFAFALSALSSEQRIICLGDSLTAGYGVQESEAWPALLQKQLNKEHTDSKVINAGTSGATSAGGLRKLPWLFKKKVDVLIIALGANDGLRGLSTEVLEENLQKIITSAKKKNPSIRIILAGMKMPPNMGKEYTSKFEALYPRLAKKNDIELLPFMLEGVAGHPKMNLADGIHPNSEGHKIISNLIWKVLIKKDL
ncbi:arylesterase [Lentisphaera profundi]|uniref:Arylesterase n=1 Tax=Lentisphaera profundi TaxID=1658616 RepID=A0ABY7VT79_9BACT|nr:arylesterase [Lentisphaera profundi]WDE96430.1 arylesterase [Lentisphaera profundi]